MPCFIVDINANDDGKHEVHNLSKRCPHLPPLDNCIDLGTFFSCKEAIYSAKSQWPNNKINGCFYCCNLCYSS